MKRIKTTIDTWSALFWLALGLLVCYGAGRLGLGSVTDPGSGFIFFWSGSILGFLSLMLFTGSLRGVSAESQRIPGTNWTKISLVLVSLVLYGFFLERLGFVLTTFALLSFLLGLSEERKWPRALGVAGAAALAGFALFELWLKIRLPRGIFGF
ncbi:MAG: tripartite tricarboxylate transporter TctB family protein [Deltaproteobacteria bacterium]|nr:tripartite tricarboxylate transporter TctB family protein [Deltaproteobacteria bacterium]MBI2540796.1 tripartite tricarboxylate transporter TctB family protein [Deltaproteobacteria bacterium]MBI3060921.1 tripartite tricarboxylate transporter TctB family protein [Deltaproteobacteria bacterium]